MRILALQLKRIGDLVLTTPALRMLRTAWPEAHIALGVSAGCGPLAGAIGDIDTGIVFGRGRGFAPWQQALTGPWDLCVDFTGNDRSSLATALSRAKVRATFEWVRRNRMRALVFNRFVDSPVRDRHTVDHYLDLVRQVIDGDARAHFVEPQPHLALPAAAVEAAENWVPAKPFAVIHPGTARPEKYWIPQRWAEVITHLRERHGLECAITGGADDFEHTHISKIQAALPVPVIDIAGKIDLLTFAAVIARARLCVSCDTGAVHLAAAFRKPQIALFGPTNPFHWRPRHECAVVISAARPEAPLTDFRPRMKGAPMDALSTEVVIRATDSLLAHRR